MARILFAGCLVGAVLVLPARGEEPKAPKVLELRTQQVGEHTYFHVKLETPKDLRRANLSQGWNWWNNGRRELTLVPRLVPRDEKTRTVYPRIESLVLPMTLPGQREPVVTPVERPPGAERPAQPAPGPAVAPAQVEGFEFVGRVAGNGEAKLRLLYPTGAESAPAPRPRRGAGKLSAPKRAWVETTLALDFGKAKTVAVPADAKSRKPERAPGRDDLEGLWAAAQAGQFNILENLAPDFGFYSFAREATGRKYRVPAAGMQRWWGINNARDSLRFYETTTGAAAITESLALDRLRQQNFRDTGTREVDLAKVPGINIAEHPWAKMMAGKKPAEEVLAKVVPHDNYYVSFRGLDKLIAFIQLTDLWGGNINGAIEPAGKAYHILPRYEKQLCLSAGGLAKLLPPPLFKGLAKGLAFTGSDLYLREGSDVAVIFHVTNPDRLLGLLEPFLAGARKEFGEKLKEEKDEYKGVAIENFVTPRREVSLHRAKFGEFVVYANSPAGLRRIIDTHQGKRKALADSLDFQYMRTVYRADGDEDGFAFLSDAFIRQLVGPASKIRLRRRYEALTSLALATHGAMFQAWETGKLPGAPKELLVASTLKPEMLFTPEGNDVAWNVAEGRAVSTGYNTLDFATPIIELPIDKITPQEQQEYTRFRAEYLNLWRQYFDPIGMRLKMTDGQVKLATYILPLIENSQYNELRRFTGDGTTKLSPSQRSEKTVALYVQHLAPNLEFLEPIRREPVVGMLMPALNFLGDWFMVRIEDSPVYAKLARIFLAEELGLEGEDAAPRQPGPEEYKLLFQMPITVGFSVKNPITLAASLAAAKSAVNTVLPGGIEWAPLEEPYKDVQIVRVRPRPNREILRMLGYEPNAKDPVLPALYYALVDGGLYVSLVQEPIKQLIDAAEERKKGEEGDAVEVNSSVFISPRAARQTAEFARIYLEMQTHDKALASMPALHALYRCGLLGGKPTAAEVRKVTLACLGYEPIAPEGAMPTYDSARDEMVSQRHGTLRRPTRQSTLAPGSPLAQLFEQIRNLRADLHFREDGIETTITLDRGKE